MSYYAVTNHLFPKDEYVERFVNGFANSAGRPITEFWNAPRFEMRRPEEGNEWLSTSIWQDTAGFDAWRNSQDIQRAHANTTSDPFSRRALLSFHDIVMNAEPGRAPEIGVTKPYPQLGIGTYIVMLRFYPKADKSDEVIQAFADLPLPADPGFVWWDLWKLVKGDDWWSVVYFKDKESAERALAEGFAYLREPGSPDLYEKPGILTRHEVELERVPGMSATARRAQPVGAGA
jgi:heme-degrading monooxygenase HmoA